MLAKSRFDVRFKFVSLVLSLIPGTIAIRSRPTSTHKSLHIPVFLLLLRGTIVNMTYGTHKNLHVYLISLTIFGLIYYAPPQ